MNENHIKGILGVVLGGLVWVATAGCLIVDGATGLTCAELTENPSQDVYFVVDDSEYNEDIWETAHQDPATARWNVAHDQFIVKYNANEVPRDKVQNFLNPNRPLGGPLNHEEVLQIIYTNDWIPNDGVVKNPDADPNDPEFATDDNYTP